MPAPTGVKSNIEKGVPTSSCRRPEIKILGEVPIKVASPPTSEPKESGMRNSEAERPPRWANWKATGRKIARAPIFLMKAENAVTSATSTPTCRSGDLR